MKTIGKNERIKLAYTRYLRVARRKNEATVDAALAAIDRFTAYAKRDLSQFHIRQAEGFVSALAREVNPRTKTPLSGATKLQILAHLREFVLWLADQPGYRKRIRYSDADYFSLPLKEAAAAKAGVEREGPTINQVRRVLSVMPTETDVEKRNRAVIAFVLLSGARDAAVASLRLKHVDLDKSEVFQDAREVRTKASKTMVTSFFPVGHDIRAIVEDWIAFLVRERQLGPDDPLFPATRVARGASGGFEASGLDRRCWATASPIRDIFRSAFTAAGLPYFNPHGFRKTLARLGQRVCNTPEQLKAWSQNLGHEKMLTTLTSYGAVDRRRQAEILRGLREAPVGVPDAKALAAALRLLEMAREAEGTRVSGPNSG